jgi:hypothetical protein
MKNSGPNAFGSLPFVSRMASTFKSQVTILDELIERNIPNALRYLYPLLYAIRDNCRATLFFERAQLLNETFLIQRVLIERIINTCFLVAAGRGEQEHYFDRPVAGTAGIPGTTAEEVIHAAREYRPSESGSAFTQTLSERMNIIQQELGLSKEPFQVAIASVFPQSSQILAGSLHGQLFHIGVFQRSPNSGTNESIAAHIREEFCVLFLMGIGLLDSMFDAIASRHQIPDLCARSSALFKAATNLMNRANGDDEMSLTWADGAWDRLPRLEFASERTIEPGLARFEEAFRDSYEAGLVVTVLKPLHQQLDLRLAALLLKRVLNDLRGVWILLKTGYTSQAGSIAASLYESALASICLTHNNENIDKMLKDPHGEIPWSVTAMAKMVVRAEGKTGTGPVFENAWRALYADYVWLCQLKHSSFQSVLHDATASSTQGKTYAVMATPNIKEEDSVVKAHVGLSALLRTQEAIRAFAVALGYCDPLPNEYAFSARMERAYQMAYQAFEPFIKSIPPVEISRSRFTKKYPPVSLASIEKQSPPTADNPPGPAASN